MAEQLVKLSQQYLMRSKGLASRLKPGTRLAYTLFVSVAAIVFSRVELLTVLTIASILFFLSTKPGLRKFATVILFALLVVWSIVFSQALFYRGSPRTPIATIIPYDTPVIGWLTGGVYIYYEGVYYGLRQSLRALAALYASAGFIASMSIVDLYTLLSRHPRLLAVLLSAIRSLEKMFEELGEGLAALKLSGVSLGVTSLYKLEPLLLRRIELASTSTALSIEYSSPAQTGKAWSTASLALLAAATILALLYILYLLYSTGIYAPPQLHKLYEHLRLWME